MGFRLSNLGLGKGRELQDGVTAQRIQGERKVVSCWNLLHKSVPQLPVIPEFRVGLPQP